MTTIAKVVVVFCLFIFLGNYWFYFKVFWCKFANSIFWQRFH